MASRIKAVDIELLSFQINESTSHSIGDAEWIVKKIDRWTHEVTLKKKGSSVPISAWLTGSAIKQTVFNPGETQILTGNSHYCIRLHYIKNKKRRKYFDSFNLYCFSRIGEGRTTSLHGSNLEFTSTPHDKENASIIVKHKRDPSWRGKVKLWRWNLSEHIILEAGKENLINYQKCSEYYWIYLEEKNENVDGDTNSTSHGIYPKDDIYEFLERKTTFDFSLKSNDGHCIGTHRILLEARTSLLVKEKEVDKGIQLQVSKAVLKDFAHFLIHDEVKDMQANSLQLFELACKYDVSRLRQQCENHFKCFQVSSENEGEVERLAYEYKCEALQEILSDYQMSRNEYKFDTPSSIADDLSSAGDDESDVTLISRDKKEVKCFSLLLACRSKVFKKTLQLELKWQPGQKATISVPDFDADVLTEFVHFLKTDTVINMKDHALQLLLLADNYRVCKLGIQCIDYICDHFLDFHLTDLLRASKIVCSHKLSRTINAYFKNKSQHRNQ